MTSVIIPVALLVSFLSFCHTVFLFAYLSLGVAIKGATSFSWQGKSQVAGECYHRGGRLSKTLLALFLVRTYAFALAYITLRARYSLYVLVLT